MPSEWEAALPSHPDRWFASLNVRIGFMFAMKNMPSAVEHNENVCMSNPRSEGVFWSSAMTFKLTHTCT